MSGPGLDQRLRPCFVFWGDLFDLIKEEEGGSGTFQTLGSARQRNPIGAVSKNVILEMGKVEPRSSGSGSGLRGNTRQVVLIER